MKDDDMQEGDGIDGPSPVEGAGGDIPLGGEGAAAPVSPEASVPDQSDSDQAAEPPSGPPRPVIGGDRLLAMDLARGLALLGIFFVNVQFFFEPLGSMVLHEPPSDAGASGSAAWYFVRIFCYGKFYPLFSTLFGMGLVLQGSRVVAAGSSFTALYLRRLALLGIIGVSHALFLWYGDILAYYSVAGIALLLAWQRSARTLMGVAVVLILLSSACMGGCQGLQEIGRPPAPAAEDASAPTEGDEDASATGEATSEAADDAVEPPFSRFIEALFSGRLHGPEDQAWKDLETEAYREWGYGQQFRFRAATWAMAALSVMFGMGPHLLGMFFLGAALVKLDFFAPERRRWHWTFVALGLLVGLPLAVLGAFQAKLLSGQPVLGPVMAMTCNMLAGPLMSLAYLSVATLVINGGFVAGLSAAIQATGRMALTNYLGQTVVATGVSYTWGLGLFGTVSAPMQLGFVVVVYAAQVVVSTVWMSVFRFGPCEWLWRCITYGRFQSPFR